MWGIALITQSNNDGATSFPRFLEGDLSMSMKKVAALAAAAVMAFGVVLAAPATANEGGTTEGCTPGFWKNHTDWKSYDDGANDTADDNFPDTTLSHMLRSPDGNGTDYTFPAVYGDLGSVTMLAALSQGGGSTLRGAANNLMRHAVAAYLNSDAGLAYPFRRYTVGEDGSPPLVQQIQTALNSQKRGQILALKDKLAAANELGCPLS